MDKLRTWRQGGRDPGPEASAVGPFLFLGGLGDPEPVFKGNVRAWEGTG